MKTGDRVRSIPDGRGRGRHRRAAHLGTVEQVQDHALTVVFDTGPFAGIKVVLKHDEVEEVR